ncbi:MAG TPA: muconolactone Delta-isomerase family protein [Chloroflexota bacterium]|nr:muconolactone Delta-isomerase family protein [Chloroflexota bacterium]
MRFLVTGEWVEVGALLSPEQTIGVLEDVVHPSLELLARWEQEGRIRGGIQTGQRAGSFIVDAASAEELGEMLASLPFWGMVKWQVVSLQSFQSTVERERGVALRARGASKP